MSEKDFIVIHGSAVKFVADKTTTLPRDVDVVYGGNFSEADAIAAAKDWVKKNDLPASLPIDCQRQHGWEDKVYLPVPCETSLLRYEVVVGEVEIVASVFKGLASYIRAYGHNADELQQQILKVNSLRLGIIPKKGGNKTSWGDWDDYVQGPTALRSAIRHSSDWQRILELLPFGLILDRLTTEDPRPKNKNFLKALEYGSPESSPALEIVFFWEEGEWKITTQYLSGKLQRTWTPEELERLLWPDSEWYNVGPATSRAS